MAKRKGFEVTAEAPEVAEAIAEVALEVPAEMETVVAADAALPFGEREVIPIMLNRKCGIPFAVGDCLAVVTLPPGMTIDMLAYAIRHGYAGPRA